MIDFWILGQPHPLRRRLVGWTAAAALLFGAAGPVLAVDVNDYNGFINAIAGGQSTINITGPITFPTTPPIQPIPPIVVNTTITGVNGVQNIDGNGVSRPFFIYDPNNIGVTVTISNLHIMNTLAQGGAGGDGAQGSGGGGLGAGGAIFVGAGATVTIDNVSFDNNAAQGGNAGAATGTGTGGGGGLGGDAGSGQNNGGGAGGGFGGVGGDGNVSGGGGGAFSNAGDPGVNGGGGNGGGPDGGGGGGANAPGDPGTSAVGPDGGGGGGGNNTGSALGGGAGGDGGYLGGGGGGGSAEGMGPGGTGGAGGDYGGGGGGGNGTASVGGGSTGSLIGSAGFGGGGGGTTQGGNSNFGGGGGGSSPVGTAGISGAYGGAGNMLGQGGGGAALGGAIFVQDSGMLIIRNSGIGTNVTLTGGTGANTGSTSGAGIYIQSAIVQYDVTTGSVTIASEIADNSPDNNGNGSASDLTKTGAGTLILSAANAYAGATQVNGGTLQVSALNNLGFATSLEISNATLAVQGTFSLNDTGATPGATPVTLTGVGTIDVSSGNTFTVGGVIGGTGGLAKTGVGVLVLSGANTFDGDVSITGGTLSEGASNVIPDDVAVTINGTGAVFAIGSNNDLVDTVTLVDGSITGTSGILSSTNNFDVRSGTISAILGGSSGLDKSTAGTVTLSGANTYGGATSVSAGTLIVNGSIISPTTVVAGATLMGDGNGTTTGLITGTLTNNGTIDPGAAANAIGTLTVMGAYNGGGTSTFHVDFDGTNNDLVNATTATLDGAVFVHGFSGAMPVINQQYVFLSTTGGVMVSPTTTISDDLPLVNATLGFTANDVYFIFVSSGVNFASVALTPNELAVATYLDQTAGTASGDYQFVIDNLNLLTAPQLRAAFNQMSGEAHGTAGQFGVNTTTIMLQQVANHLSAAAMFGPEGSGVSTNLMAQVSPTANAAASPNNIQLVSHNETLSSEAIKAETCCLCYDTCENQKHWNGWSAGYGLGGSAQSDGNASGASYGVGGFLAGVDRWIDDSTLVGVFGGYSGSGFSTTTPSANVHDNAGQGGLYALRRGDVLYASAIVGGQSDQYTSRRNINFGAIQRTATGNYDGWQGFGYSELGANLGEQNLKLQPFAALQYIHLRQNSISETGAGSLNLFSGGMDTDSLRSFLGTRVRYDNQGDNNLRRFIPELQASWLHEYIDASTALNARFGAVGGNGFITNGLNVGRDWALLGAGVTYVVTDNIRLTANYYAQTNDRQTYHVGAGGLSIQW